MRNGFTLVEVLVVVLVIGILMAVALPNYSRVRDKARETQVRANVHKIQSALERYAVDHPDGLYPAYLYGGDCLANWDSDPSGVGRLILQEHGASMPPPSHPIWWDCVEVYGPGALCSKMLYMSRLEVVSWSPSPHRTTKPLGMDPLEAYGLLPVYPRNPFGELLKLKLSGTPATNPYYPASIAGRDGVRTFALPQWDSLPWRLPGGPYMFVNFFAGSPEPDTPLGREYGEPVLDVPGVFSYHIIVSSYSDSIFSPYESDADSLPTFLEAKDYLLAGYGTIYNPGLDVGGKAPWQPSFPAPSNDAPPYGYWSMVYWYEKETGYGAFSWMPDGWPDFVIITVSSGPESNIKKWFKKGEFNR